MGIKIKVDRPDKVKHEVEDKATARTLKKFGIRWMSQLVKDDKPLTSSQLDKLNPDAPKNTNRYNGWTKRLETTTRKYLADHQEDNQPAFQHNARARQSKETVYTDKMGERH